MRRAAGHAVTLVFLVAPQAGALPLLGVMLQGDPGEVGRGGAGVSPFAGASPATELATGLLGASQGRLEFDATGELAIDVRHGRFAGTRSRDDHLALQAGLPFSVDGQSFALAANVRRDLGDSEYSDTVRGLDFHLSQRQFAAEVGGAAELAPNVQIAGALVRTSTGATGYTLSVTTAPRAGLLFGYRRHVEPVYAEITSPPVEGKRFTSPPIDVVVNQAINTDWLTAHYAGHGLESGLEMDMGPNHDLRAELGGTAGPVTLQTAYDRRAVTLGGSMVTSGPPIADGSITFRQSRAMGRILVSTAAGDFAGGGSYGNLSSSLDAHEVNDGLGRALLNMKVNLGGYFDSATGVNSKEAFLGYRAHPFGLELDLGAHYAHLDTPGSTVIYGASQLHLTGADSLDPGTIDLLAATVALGVHLGTWTMQCAFAQFVPLALNIAGTSNGGASAARAPPTATIAHAALQLPGPTIVDRIRSAIADYPGGRYSMLRLSRSW